MHVVLATHVHFIFMAVGLDFLTLLCALSSPSHCKDFITSSHFMHMTGSSSLLLQCMPCSTVHTRITALKTHLVHAKGGTQARQLAGQEPVDFIQPQSSTCAFTHLLQQCINQYVNTIASNTTSQCPAPNKAMLHKPPCRNETTTGARERSFADARGSCVSHV